MCGCFHVCRKATKKLIPANGQTSPVKSTYLCKNKHIPLILFCWHDHSTLCRICQESPSETKPLQNKRKKQVKRPAFSVVAEMGFEPHDLRVMSPTSYRTALLRDIHLSAYIEYHKFSPMSRKISQILSTSFDNKTGTPSECLFVSVLQKELICARRRHGVRRPGRHRRQSCRRCAVRRRQNCWGGMPGGKQRVCLPKAGCCQWY